MTTFITGNQNKADYLAKYLGHPVVHRELDLDELKSVDLKQMWMPVKKAWQMWLVFNVKPQYMEFGLGTDADEWGFLDPEQFKNSSSRTERWIYEYGHLKRFALETVGA